MGVRGIGLEGVQMRSRKRSVFVYSYSGLLDAKLAMVDMHEFRLEKEKTITMYEIYIYICMDVCRNKQKSIEKKGQRSGEVRRRVSAAIAGPMHENKISCIG